MEGSVLIGDRLRRITSGRVASHRAHTHLHVPPKACRPTSYGQEDDWGRLLGRDEEEERGRNFIGGVEHCLGNPEPCQITTARFGHFLSEVGHSALHRTPPNRGIMDIGHIAPVGLLRLRDAGLRAGRAMWPERKRAREIRGQRNRGRCCQNQNREEPFHGRETRSKAVAKANPVPRS